jgi:hypothetical protein
LIVDPKFLAELRARLAEAERRAKEAREFITKAIEAGVDVSEQEKALAELEASIARMKRVYGIG